MDNDTTIFAILTFCLVGVTIQAVRLGNEKRDVTLLGLLSGLLGTGTAVSLLF